MAAAKLDTPGLLGALYDAGSYVTLFDGRAGAVAAFGMVGAQGVYAVCQTGEAMGADDVEVCRQVLRLAADTGNPVVTFYASPGVKMDEGLAPLKAVSALSAEAGRLSGVVPQVAVVCGVCGASAALAAAASDVCIMTKDAQLFLTPPFLARAKGDKTPGGTPDAAVKAGVVAAVAEDDAEAVALAGKIVTLLPQNNLAEAPAFEFEAAAVPFPTDNYTGPAAVDGIADSGSMVELFAGFGDGVTTALATVAGNVVGIVATNGPDTYIRRLCAARAARFVRLCDAYSVPVVTVLNSGGFAQSSTDEQAGGLRAATRLAATYADATCAKVCVLAGRSFGTLYTAMANADLTIALEGSVTAPAAPEAAASVLYKAEIEADGRELGVVTAEYAKRYEAEVASAKAVQKAGLADMLASPVRLRGTVAVALDILGTKRAQRLPKKHGSIPL